MKADMIIGALGNIAFEVSREYANSFEELKREHSWKYAEHEIVKGKSKLQPLGKQLMTGSFKGKLLDNFCVPLTELKRLTTAADKQQALAFVMGSELLGNFVIEKISETWRNVTGDGQVRMIEFEVSLKEYN